MTSLTAGQSAPHDDRPTLRAVRLPELRRCRRWSVVQLDAFDVVQRNLIDLHPRRALAIDPDHRDATTAHVRRRVEPNTRPAARLDEPDAFGCSEDVARNTRAALKDFLTREVGAEPAGAPPIEVLDALSPVSLRR